jgi:hypothetical protein
VAGEVSAAGFRCSFGVRVRGFDEPDAGPGATVYLDAVVGVWKPLRLKLAGVPVGRNLLIVVIFPSTAH